MRSRRPHRRLRAVLAALPALLAGCGSVHTTDKGVDALSFSPWLGLSLLGVAVLLALPGVFFLFTPPRVGAPKAPRKAGAILLVLFGLALAAAGLWRLTWRIELHGDHVVLRSLFGYAAIPYVDINEVLVREYQNRWHAGTRWETIVLVRKDGSSETLSFATLSPQDQAFLEEVLAAHHGDRAAASTETPVVGGGHGTEAGGPPPDMAAKPPVTCPVLAGQAIAFCSVCGQQRNIAGGRVARFTCSRCGRTNDLKYITPPRLVFLGVMENKAAVRKDNVVFYSGYGEEVAPGTGFLNEGYDAQGNVLTLSHIEQVTFTDYREAQPKEVTRPLKLPLTLRKQ